MSVLGQLLSAHRTSDLSQKAAKGGGRPHKKWTPIRQHKLLNLILRCDDLEWDGIIREIAEPASATEVGFEPK
jgi:hypothetical protein